MAQKKLPSIPVPSVDFDAQWAVLGPISAQALNYSNVDGKIYQTGHSCIYDLFLSSRCTSGRFYEEVVRLMRSHVQELYRKVIQEPQESSRSNEPSGSQEPPKSQEPQNILTRYSKQWSQFKKGFDCFNDIYSYANLCSRAQKRFVVDEDRKFETTDKLGKYLWETEVVLKVERELFPVVLDGIDRIRDQDRTVTGSADSKVIKAIIESLIFLDDSGKFYLDHLEPEVLSRARQYYDKEADKIGQLHMEEYARFELDIEREERIVLGTFLHREFHEKVLEQCRDALRKALAGP